MKIATHDARHHYRHFCGRRDGLRWGLGQNSWYWLNLNGLAGPHDCLLSPTMDQKRRWNIDRSRPCIVFLHSLIRLEYPLDKSGIIRIRRLIIGTMQPDVSSCSWIPDNVLKGAKTRLDNVRETTLTVSRLESSIY